MARSRFFVRLTSCVLGVCLAAPALAVQPSEKLLPNTTKGFVSTQDVDEVRTKFSETQLGEFVHDPLMEPFIEDFKKQVGQKLEKAGRKLGLRWPDLEGVYAGEVALALAQPDPKDKMSHATILIVDITGKQAQADALLKKVEANQKANKARRATIKAGDVEIVSYTQPLRPDEKVAETAYYFIKDGQLVVTDHLGLAKDVLRRFSGVEKDTLESVEAFAFTMQRNADAAGGDRHHVRWFLEPLGYVETARAAEGGRKKRGTDPLKILQGEGFTAAQGIGGYVFFALNGREVTHRTFVYAPPVKRPKDDPNKDRHNLSMRMLDFPTSPPGTLEPQAWAMADMATYGTFNWKMQAAFKYSESLVDAIIADKGAWQEIWKGMKEDEFGPRIDIFKELINHLGERATLLADVTTPVGLKSERLLALVEVTDPVTVAKTVEKAFKSDPSAKKRVYKGQIIWELTEEEIAGESPELMIEGGFVAGPEKKKDEADDKEDKEKVLPNMAITVFQGHLVVSTHLNFVEELIDKATVKPNLAAMPDYIRVKDELLKLGSGQDSFRFFTRTDESYRATYELIQQGKLPQAETMLARLLNALMGPTEEGVVREQEIDGSKLPPFEKMKKYLGPGGVYVQQEEKFGWWIVGCLLKK